MLLGRFYDELELHREDRFLTGMTSPATVETG
jgi:hypothetical protein